MRFGIALLSLVGAKLKLKTAQAFYKFDPQVEKWDSDWDYLDNAKCKGTKHLFFVSQIAEEECCSPRSENLAKSAANRVWELSRTISDKVTVTSFSDGFGGLLFYQELDDFFDNKCDYFMRPELEIFGDVDKQDPVVYERSENMCFKERKNSCIDFVGTYLDRKLQDEYSQGKDSQDKDSHGKDSQDKESQEKDSQGKDSQDKENQEKDSQGKDSQDKDCQGNDSQDKESQEKDSQGKDSQDKDCQDKDSQGKDSQDKDSQDKDSQGKDSQGKDSQGKDSKGKYSPEEVQVYILPPKVIQYVTLKLLQLPTSSWSRYIFNKASITWLQINSSGNVFAHSINDCSYEGANRALYEEDR